MINIGIISFAHMHAYSYAQALNDLPDVQLTALWDADPQRGKAAAQDHNATFHAKLHHLLASDIQGVIICSENIHHRAHTEAAAQAGKWILCEKPLATTLEDALAMIAACKKAKVGLGTAFPCRYVATLQDLKQRLDQGEIGDLIAVACTNNGQFPGGWFVDPALSGGGAVMDHTVHIADLMRWLTGKEFTKVYCEKGRLLHDDIKTDDVGSLHLEMQGGLKVSHVASWNRPESFATWGDITLDLAGTKGSLFINAFNEKVDVYSNAGTKTEWAPYGANADHGLVTDFIRSIREQNQPAITGQDGLQTLKLTLAAEKSAKAGEMVRV
mgnify:CR=1 FL=1